MPADACSADACATGVTRLIAPLSAARVSSQRPTLRWIPGATITRLEICGDRACTSVEHMMNVSSDRASPPSALGRGVHYWRASALVGGRVGTASATWEFFVGHRSAPADSSYGCVPDFNGDGYADVAVGATFATSSRGRVFVYYGAAGGPPSVASEGIAAPDGASTDGGVAEGREGQFGGALACAGDVNGDGFADLVVGARAVDMLQGRAYVFLGSAAGLRADAPLRIPGTDGFDSYFGAAVAGVGDVNGDGYSEVAVGAWNAIGGSRVHVYAGGPSGTSLTAAFTLRAGEVDGDVGTSIAGDDFNGDGYSDLLVGNSNARGSAGWAWVLPGSVAGLSAARVTDLANGPGLASMRVVVASAGDVDGDGRPDVILGAAALDGGMGRAFVHLGGAAGVSSTARTTLPGRSDARGTFGASVASAGDVDGDGFSDVVVGAFEVATRAGRAWVYLGGGAGVATTAAATLDGGAAARFFGLSVAGAGDVEGDGFDDVVVGAPGSRITGTDPDGVYLFRGRAGATLASGMLLTGLGGRFDQFGDSVASITRRGPRRDRRRWCALR